MLYEVPIPTTSLSKLVRSCRISSGGADLKVPNLNSYVSEVVLIGFLLGLDIYEILSLISTSFLTISVFSGSIID